MQAQRLWQRSHYIAVLRAFAAFHEAWEAAVETELPPHLLAWAKARSRLRWLRQDLQYFQVAPASAAALAPFEDAAAALGSLYVMEGSSLGGRVIAASLAQSGLTHAGGAAYFHGWGEATGPMWKQFRQVLDAELGCDDAAIDSACAGACRTFDTLTTLFHSNVHERAALA